MTQQDAPEGGAGNRVDLGPAKYDFGRKLNAIVTASKTWEDAAERAAALFARPADRQRDATGIVGEAIAVARAAQGPHTIALTPPAPVGLVDAARAYLAATDAFDAFRNEFAEDEGSRRHTQEWNRLGATLIAARATLDATLSGQQGGAVPAGGRVEAALDQWFSNPRWREVYRDGPDVRSYMARAIAASDRARLAEQPAPAGTGEVELVEELSKALCWATDEIDALSNRLCGFGYPQGMGLLGRHDQAGHYVRAVKARRTALAATATDGAPGFAFGDRVRKTKGSSWRGRVVGTYSTSLTPRGYAVESEREPGSVQIYPEAALELATDGAQRDGEG